MRSLAVAESLCLLCGLVLVTAGTTAVSGGVRATAGEGVVFRAYHSIGRQASPHCKRSSEEHHREIRSATVRDCGRSAEAKLLKLEKLRLDVNQSAGRADEIVVLSFAYNTSAALPEGVALELRLEKSVLGVPFRLPCLPSKKQPSVFVGSCTYKDFCVVPPSSRCPESLADPPEARGTPPSLPPSPPCPCSNAVRPSRWRPRSRTLAFALPSELLAAYLNLSNGEYTMKIELVHTKTMRVLGCVEAKWTLAARRKRMRQLARETGGQPRRAPFGA